MNVISLTNLAVWGNLRSMFNVDNNYKGVIVILNKQIDTNLHILIKKYVVKSKF